MAPRRSDTAREPKKYSCSLNITGCTTDFVSQYDAIRHEKEVHQDLKRCPRHGCRIKNRRIGRLEKHALPRSDGGEHGGPLDQGRWDSTTGDTIGSPLAVLTFPSRIESTERNERARGTVVAAGTPTSFRYKRQYIFVSCLSLIL